MLEKGQTATEIGKFYKTLYLEKMNSEIDQCDVFGKFIKETDEFWYQYRRFHMLDYLKAIYLAWNKPSNAKTKIEPDNPK